MNIKEDKSYQEVILSSPVLVPTPRKVTQLRGGGGGGGVGVQGKLFWMIRIELWAPQVPLIIRETVGEVLGPRHPVVSELRPAQKLGVK